MVAAPVSGRNFMYALKDHSERRVVIVGRRVMCRTLQAVDRFGRCLQPCGAEPVGTCPESGDPFVMVFLRACVAWTIVDAASVIIAFLLL